MDINYSQKTSILLTKRTQCQSHGVLFLMEAMMEIKEISITSCKVSVIFGSECLKCNSLLISWVLNWPASVSCLGMQIMPQFHDLQPKVRLSMIFVIYFRVFWKQFHKHWESLLHFRDQLLNGQNNGGFSCSGCQLVYF